MTLGAEVHVASLDPRRMGIHANDLVALRLSRPLPNRTVSKLDRTVPFGIESSDGGMCIA